MGADQLVPVVDDGLGNSAYLLDLGDGRALAVDPSRDLRKVYGAAARRGLQVAYAAETHLHADFVSGSRQLHADHDAAILASAAGKRVFDHVRLGDGDEIDLGGLTLRAMQTPGHTPEHLSYLILDGSTEVGVFTGGSLIVGAAARTDLIGSEYTVELARAQYASLRRLATLPDPTAVWPTHGAGSFCSAPPGVQRVSTIGREKATNPLLGASDEDTFVARLLGSLGSYPTYFAYLAEVNRRGPSLIDRDPVLAELTPADTRRLLADGAVLVDVRPVRDYAAGHIPHALSIPLRDQFATWLGWLLTPETPVVVVRNHDQDPADIVWAALAIGFEQIHGELAGGVPRWTAEGGVLRHNRLLGPDQIDAGLVVDVRQDSEFEAAHIPAARHVELGDLLRGARELPAVPTVVMCGHGERATTAASLLERAGHRDIAVLVGGPDDWATATGHALARGR
jgi:glyoxylase-like metal-dependent hydrolase (beta-lactamase superfamily II)